MLKRCDQCGASLPRRARGGLCPRCLLGQQLVKSDDPAAHAPITVAPGVAPGVPGSLGDYDLIEPLGHGGMGVVYKARQRSLKRTVALKMLPFGMFTRDELIRRFRAEAEAAARLRHPNIVTIYEVGHEGGHHFFSMEFIDGPSLAEVVTEQPLSVARAARLTRTVAEAIAHAHGKSTVHRDLKPSNILIDTLDQPHVTDFGLARVLGGDGAATASASTLGSPSYLPPERALGLSDAVAELGDVYALGAILYHLLTGRPPFVGENIAAVLHQVVHDEPVSPRLLRPTLPCDLETISLKCLEKEPGRRYHSAQALADELARFQADQPILARPVSLPERGWRWCRRRPAVAGAAGVSLIVLLTGLLTTSWQWRRANQEASSLARTVRQLEFDRAEDQLTAGETAKGLARFARLLRQNPEDRLVARRLLSALTMRNFVHPTGSELPLDRPGGESLFAQSGALAAGATYGSKSIFLWNTKGRLEPVRSIACGAPIVCTCLSEDGRQLLTADENGLIRLHEVSTGRLLSGPCATHRHVEHLILSPDKQSAIAVTSPGYGVDSWKSMEVCQIELANETLRHRATNSHWAVLSPDGQYLVTLSGKQGRFLNPNTWETRGESITQKTRINFAAFSHDSRLLVTATAGGVLQVWDVRTSSPASQALNLKAHLMKAIFSPDDATILTADISMNARLWDWKTGLPTGEPFRQSDARSWRAPAGLFSSDSRWLLSSYENRLTLRDGRTGSARAESREGEWQNITARFFSDNQRFAIIPEAGLAQIWEMSVAGLAPLSWAHVLQLMGAAWSPAANRVVTYDKTGVSIARNALYGQPLSEADCHGSQALCSQFSPDEKLVVSASANGTAWIWNASNGQQVGPALHHRRGVYWVEFSPDANWIATASEDGTARLWDAHTMQPSGKVLQHEGPVVFATFSPDGQFLVTCSRDHSARVWSVPDGEPQGEPLRHAEEVTRAQFSPDGRTLATASRYGRIWDWRTGRESSAPLGHSRSVRSIEFSPNGARVVTASSDGTARIWEAATGRVLTRPMVHEADVISAQFSPDGQFILTASHDNTARIWDAATGNPISERFRHDDKLTAARWSPVGRRILTASFDRSARIYELPFLPDEMPPAWLPELAEAIGGMSMQGEEIYLHVPATRLLGLKKRLKREAQDGLYWKCAVRFLNSSETPLPSSAAPSTLKN